LLGIGGDLLTVVVGTDGAGLVDPIRQHLAKRAPLVELSSHRVDALDCLALLGIE
jgi:hypothetical protein